MIRFRAGGGTAKAFQADVLDEEAIKSLYQAIESEWGPVEILVINATADQPFIPLEKLTWRDCLDQLEFFVKSPILLAQNVVAGMKARQQGRIIHIGSEVFEKGVPKFSSYVSAKGAQLGLCRSWANELAPWQITVNLVAPGWIPTERHVNDPQEDKDAYAKAVPMGRMGDPEDVAHAVAYLASDAAKFVSGQKN